MSELRIPDEQSDATAWPRIANADNELGNDGWVNHWSGSGGGNCVEVKRIAPGKLALRNSNDPEGPAVIYSEAELRAFIEGAKLGLADSVFE